MKLKYIVLGTLLISSIQFAHSAVGTGSSGGGFAVVCRNADGKINSAELLDLYEAKNKFKYNLIESTGSLEGDYISSVSNTYRLQGYEGDVLIDSNARKNLDKFLASVVFLGKDQILPNLYDLGDHMNAPAGCDIEPLAIWYDDKDLIKIKFEIWDNLSTLDQAALVQHEISYHYERGFYEKTSEGARAFVSTIFSVNASPVLDENTKRLPWAMAISSDAITSEKTYTAFTYKLDGSQMALNLFTIMNRPLVTKATAYIDLSGVVLKNAYNEMGNGQVVIAQTDKVEKRRTHILTEQNNKWDIEFTFIPNMPVKIGFYQKGVLIQESILTHL